jgi:hypothetical protein
LTYAVLDTDGTEASYTVTLDRAPDAGEYATIERPHPVSAMHGWYRPITEKVYFDPERNAFVRTEF